MSQRWDWATRCRMAGVTRTSSQLPPAWIMVTPSETHLPHSPMGLSAPLPNFIPPAFSFLHTTPVCGNLATSSFVFLGSRSHLLILRFSSLLGTYIGKHPPPGSWSPAGTGPQKPLQGEAVLGSGTSAFARSLPLAWSWLPTGRIVPIRNVNHYKLEAFHESVSTALLQRCITKANFGAFSGGWQKAHPLHDSSSYWEMWRRKFPAKEKVTRICQHVRCLSSSHSQKEQGFQTHYSKKVSSPSWQLKTSQITRNWKWSLQNGEVLGGIEDLTDSLYFLLGRHIHVHSQSHTVLFIYLNFNYCWLT